LKKVNLFQADSVHQIELEIQNLELMEAKEQAAELATEKYAELYDFAPSSYFTLSKEGKIIELNLCGAQMLGKERLLLKNSLFGFFISNDTKPVFNLFLGKVFKRKTKETCEVTLSMNNNLPMYVHLTGIVTGNEEKCFVTAVDITEYKQIEEALRGSEKKFNDIVSNLDEGFYSCTLDGLLLEYNLSFKRILGIDPDHDMKGVIIPDFWQNPQERLKYLDKLMNNGFISNYLVDSKTMCDEKIVVMVNSHLVKDENGKVVRIDGTLADFTERKRMEEALRESEEHHRRLVEASFDFIYVIDRDDTVKYANPAALKALGKSAAEVFGKPRVSFFPPAIAVSQKLSLDQVFTTGKPLFLDQKTELAGIAQYQETQLIPLKDAGGETVSVLGISNNITERKLAEDEMKKSSQLLRDTGEMVKVGGWELDLSSREISWTEEVGRIHGVGPGYKPKLEEGLNFYAPESRPAVEEAVKRAAETGEPYDLESLFIPSGSKNKIWVRSLGKAVYSSGKIVKLTGTFQDIDKYKRAEEELRKSKDMLEQLNKHVTEVREQERATIARDLHDQLGQSLTAIKLDLNWILQQETINSEIRTKLKGMVDLVTTTLLDTQRISSELRPGILDDLGLATAIEWYANAFEKRTELKVNLDLDEVQTMSDQKNLTLFRVMQEALTNVTRHAHAKTIQITLSEIKKHIILEINDDGIGIPVDILTSSNSIGIMGMIERVRQSGGQINISPGKAMGTLIRVRIPVHDIPAEKDE